jgi:hypothetical protein
MKVSLKLVEETNVYLPSNWVLAVGGDGVCAFVAASEMKNPAIHNQPTSFCICLLPLRAVHLPPSVYSHPRKAGVQSLPLAWTGGNRCGLAGLEFPLFAGMTHDPLNFRDFISGRTLRGSRSGVDFHQLAMRPFDGVLGRHALGGFPVHARPERS